MTRIAIVDDEVLVGRSFTRLLIFFGYETVYFPSSEALLESGELESLDCLLLDLQLPGLNGFELALKLRREGVRTPVVLISGNVDEAPEAGIAELDRVETIAKPCLPDTLNACLKRVMSME